MENKGLALEWSALQNQFDSYEKHSLYIKLLSITLMLVAMISGVASFFIALLLGILWLQDAIWKTFQSRIEPRLLHIEQSILQNSHATAFQFNSEYNKVCLSGLALISEYFRQSIRPTVAFPHLVLILILLVQYLF